MSTAKRKRDGPETEAEEPAVAAAALRGSGLDGAGPSDDRDAQGAGLGGPASEQARPPPASNAAAAAERPKTCVHEVARNPNFVEQLSQSIHGTIDNPKYTGPMAKHYPFTLDPFQVKSPALQHATLCFSQHRQVTKSAANSVHHSVFGSLASSETAGTDFEEFQATLR